MGRYKAAPRKRLNKNIKKGRLEHKILFLLLVTSPTLYYGRHFDAYIPYHYIYVSWIMLALLGVSLFFLKNKKKKQWIEQQRNIHDLSLLSWDAFERLVAEAFTRKGWKASLNGQGGADGGVDIFLRKGLTKGIVQVKHWKGRVGAPIVREQYGLMKHHRAESAYIIGLGGFTKDAHGFAKGKSIYLIDGVGLLGLLHKN